MKNINILKNTPFTWTSWAPRIELSPEFFIDGQKLKIMTNENNYAYGKFLSGEISVSGPGIIIFEASFTCQNVKNIEKSVFAMLSFYNGEKKLLERDYADIVVKNGVKKLYRKLDAPETAAYVILEIGLRYCANAVAEWDNISLEFEPAEAMPHRIVRIATTYKDPQDSPEKNLDDMIDVINKAGKSNPDVILLSELLYETCYNSGDKNVKSQPVPGPLTDKIGEYAKKYNTYIIFTMNERDGDIIYNTGVIIGRDGLICGKYRKTHLPLAEAEWGTSPGDTHKVFDFDFGRVGIIICYDQYFPENSRTLALMGAGIIFIPTQGEDEIVQRAIARTNGVYVVVSGYQDPAHSRIINPLGEIINFVPDKNTAYAAEEIDLNKRFFVYWMSVGEGNGEIKDLFRKERNIETYGAINKESYDLR